MNGDCPPGHRRVYYADYSDLFTDPDSVLPTEAGVKLAGAMERSQRLHEALDKAADAMVKHTAYLREGMAVSWLRHNLPWYYRWVIGYPRLIRALDWLGLITLPVFTEFPS